LAAAARVARKDISLDSTTKDIGVSETSALGEVEESFGVWDPSVARDRQKWLSHWESWPDREIAAHPSYTELFSTDESHRARAAYWKSEKENIIYPFILRDIDMEDYGSVPQRVYCDITSAYGYGGPFCWQERETKQDGTATKFWRCFDEWTMGQGVISEFVRFSLFGDKLLDFPGECHSKLTNIVCTLNQSEEELWLSVKPKVRRNVNKAKREGVTVVRDEKGELIEDFQRIYASTMDRRNADQCYYFLPEFFETLNRTLEGQYAYFHAVYQGKVISSELVLIASDNVYFFLGGTDSQYYSLRPNELLKYEIMCWANEVGKSHYVLGGGYKEHDGVFQYKKSFSPEGLVTFRVGQRIHNQAVYDQLSSKCPSDCNFFPRYRSP